MTDPILEYKQKPLEGYGSSNEGLINIIPHNDLFGRLGALSQTPVAPHLQLPDLSKLLTQPKVSGPLAKLDIGYKNPTDNLWAKSINDLRNEQPDLFNPIHRVTSLPGSFVKEYTNTDSNYSNMFTRAMGQMAKGATVGGAVGATIGAGVSVPVGGVGAIPGWGIGAIVGGVTGLLGLSETSGKQGFKFNVNNQEETSQRQSGFVNALGGFANNVVDRSFEASVGGTAALLSTPFGAMSGKDFYNMGQNPLSSHLADSLEESEFKMKLSNNYLNSGPIAKFFTREGFANDAADMVGFTVGMIAGTKMQGGANLIAGKIAGIGADALGYTEAATKMSTVGLLRSPSGFLLGRNTTIANEAGLAATKGLSAIATGKGIALTAEELVPMFKTGFGGGAVQFGKNVVNNGVKSAFGELSANYGTKLANLFKDGSVGLSYLKNFERTALASYGEARVEALQSYNDIYNAAIKHGDTPEQAIEKATEGANKTLFGNMVLLGITNQVALNNLIESPSRLKSLAKWFDDAWKYDGSTRNMLKNALTLKGDSLLKNVGRNFIMEGFAEELGQHALSEGSKNYVMNKNNPIHQSFLAEFGQAYKDGISSDEGISNWFGGGLFGAAMGLGGGGMHLMNDKKAAKEYSLEPSFLKRVSNFETATEFFANHMSPYDGQLYATYSEKEVNGKKVYEEDIDGDLRFVDDPTRIVKLYQALSHINRLSEDQSKVLTAPVISNIANLDENDPKFAEHKEAIESVREYFDYLDLSEKIYSGQTDAFSNSKKEIEDNIAEIDNHLQDKSLDPLFISNLNSSKEQLLEQLDSINQHLTKAKSSQSMIEASKKEAPKSIADYAEANDFKKTSIMKGLQLIHNTSQELKDVFSFKHDLEPLYIDLVKTNHVADYVIRGVEEKLFAELEAFEKDLTTSNNLSFMGSTFKSKDEARSKINEFKKSLEEQVELYKKILFRYGNPVTTAILKNKDGKHFKRNVYVDSKVLLRSAVTQRHLSDKYQKNEKLKEKIQLETILNNPELYKKYLDPKFTYDDLLKDIDKGIFSVKVKKEIEDYTPEVIPKLKSLEKSIEEKEALLEATPNDPTITAELASLTNEYDDLLDNSPKVKQEIEVDDFKKTREITDPIEASFIQLKTYQKNQKDIQDMLTKENELYLRHTNIDWIVNQAQINANIYEKQATDTKTKAPTPVVETPAKKEEAAVEKKEADPNDPNINTDTADDTTDTEITPTNFKVGDKVRFKGQTAEGTIIEFIEDGTVDIEYEDGVEYAVTLDLIELATEVEEAPIGTSTTEPTPQSPTSNQSEIERKNGESSTDYINKLFKNNYFVKVEGKKLFALTGGRWGVIVNVNGINVPFYQSTSGTDTKIAGKWYPFFGDIGNWVIKGNSDDSNVGYGFKAIQDVQSFLNTNIKETEAIALSDIVPTEINQNKENFRRLNESQIKGNDNLSISKEATAKRLSELMGYTVKEASKTKSDAELFDLASKKVFAELKALEQQPTTQEATSNQSEIERKRQEDLQKGQLFLMNDGTYGGSRLVSLEEYSAIQIQENNLDSDITKWDYNTFNGTGIFVNLSLGVAYIVPNNSYNSKKVEVVKVFINKTTKRFDLSNPRIINTPNIELVAKAANIDSKELYNEVLNAITKYDAELKALNQQPNITTEEFVDDAGEEEGQEENPNKAPKVPLTKDNLYKAFGNEAEEKVAAGKNQGSAVHKAFRSFLTNPNGLEKFPDAKLFAIPLNSPIAQTIFDTADKEYYIDKGLPIGGQVIYVYISDNKVITYNGNKFELSDITTTDLLTRMDLGDLTNIPYNKSIGYTINEKGDLSSDEDLHTLLVKNYARPKSMDAITFSTPSAYIQFIKDNGLYNDIIEHLEHIKQLSSVFSDTILDIDNKIPFLSLNINGIGKGVKHIDATYQKLNKVGILIQNTSTKPIKEHGKTLAKNAFYFKIGDNYHLTYRKTLASVFEAAKSDPTNPFNRQHLFTVLSKTITYLDDSNTPSKAFMHADLRHYLKVLLGVSFLDYPGVNFNDHTDTNGNYDISSITYPGSKEAISPSTFKNNRFTLAVDGDMRIVAYYGKNMIGQLSAFQNYSDGSNRAAENKLVSDFVDNMLNQIVSKPIPVNLARLNQSKAGSKSKSAGIDTKIFIPTLEKGDISFNNKGELKSKPVDYQELLTNNEVVTYLPPTFTDKSGKKTTSRINRYPLYSKNTLNITPVTNTTTDTTSVDTEESLTTLLAQKQQEAIEAFNAGDEDLLDSINEEISKINKKLGNGSFGKDSSNSGFRVNFSDYTDIENIPEFISWLKSVLPQFTVETSSNRIDNIAQGQYVKNLIKIWEGAQSGTGFHEAFEAVWFNMLSPKEQSDLINEFKSREGSFRYFVDGRTINFEDATNLEAKEMLAEGFREYMLTGKQSKPKAQGFFSRFFALLKSFINHIKSVFGSTPQATAFINDIYQKIANADYKDFVITDYSKETGNREDYGDAVLSYIMNGVKRSIHGEVMNKVRKDLSLNMYDIVDSMDKKELSVGINKIIDDSFNNVTFNFALWCEGVSNTLPEYSAFYAKHPKLGFVQFNPDLKEKLKKDYIDSYFKDTLLYDKSDIEKYNEENITDREGRIDPIEIDPLSKVRPVISFMISNLRYLDNDGNYVKSADLKTDKGIQLVVAYKTPNLETVKSLLVSEFKDLVLHKKFVEIEDDEYDENDSTHRERFNPRTGTNSYFKIAEFDLFTQYMSKINEIIKKDPVRFSYLKDLKSQLKADVDFDLLSDSDKQLRVSFVSSFNLTGFIPVNYSISSQGNDINDIMYDEAANKMIGNWKAYAKEILESVKSFRKNPNGFVWGDHPLKDFNKDILIDKNREVYLDLIKFKDKYNKTEKTAQDKIEILQNIGIIFSEDNLYNGNNFQNQKIEEEVTSIINILIDGKETTMSLDTFYKEYVGTTLRTLASNVGNIEGAANLSFLGPENEMQYTVINPSTESNIVNKLNSINHWDELVLNFPFMFQSNGELKPGLQHNIFLSRDGLLFEEGVRNSNKFERVLISGLKDRDKNTGEKFSSASILSQRVVSINALLDGIFSSGINADKSMENAYKLVGKNSKLTTGLLGQSKVMPIFDYMINKDISSILPMYQAQVMDEIASYFNRDKNIKTVNKLDGLLVFKDRLPTLHQMIVNKEIKSSHDTKIKEYFESKEKYGFEDEMKKYLSSKNVELFNELVDDKRNIFNYSNKFSLDTLINIFPNIKTVLDQNGNKTIEPNPYFIDKGGHTFELLKEGMLSMARLINGLTDLVVNDFVKMKSGDFSTLKADDHPKRANAPSSSKIGRDVSRNVLSTLDKIMPSTVGKHRAKVNFISLQDTVVASAKLTHRMEKLYYLSSNILKDKDGNPISDEKLFNILGATFTNGKLTGDLDIKGSVYHTYLNLDMADAQAWCLPKFYSNLFFSSGMLSNAKKKQLQYEMAVERQERSVHPDPELRYVYTDDSLKTFDENVLINEEEYNTGAILEVIKPFGFGFHRDTNLAVGTILKNSIAVLTWNRVKNNPELAKQYVLWQNKDIDVIGHESGQKQGVLLNKDNSLHPLFNEDGTRNISVPDGYIQSMEGEHFGFQVEMHDHLKEESTLGSQLSNIIIGDLKAFVDDAASTFLSPKDKERINKNIDDYLDVQRGLIYTGKQKALEKLGLRVIYENGVPSKYVSDNPEQLAKTLIESAKTLKVTINTMDLFKLKEGKFQYFFETAPKADTIEYILNSIIDKAAIHQKVKGTQAPQVSSEMIRTNAVWSDFVHVDKNGIYSHFKSDKAFKAFKGKTYQTSSALNLREDGTLEVMMPSHFKGKVDIGTLDKRLLEYVGYRIPTQSLGQIEAIEVVGFLDDTWGNAIVVPAEIVGKAGSDFDIDKLNMYMPHFISAKDENDNDVYTYVEYDNDPSEEGVKRRYDLYRNKLNKVSKFLNHLDNIIANDYEKNVLKVRSTPSIDKLMTGIFENLNDDISPYDDETIDEVLKEKKFSLELYNKVQEKYNSLKNRYMDFEAFQKLPIYNQNTREQLENRNIELIRSLTLEPINQLRHLMPNGSKNLKDYSIKINEDKEEIKPSFSNLFTFMGRTRARYTVINAKLLVSMGALSIPTHCIAQNGKLIMNPEATTTDLLEKLTTEEGLALYNIMDKAGYLISSTLSEFLSAFVDGAKDPFIMELNVRHETVSRLLLLIRSGVTPEVALRFINQPLIKEFAIVAQNSADLTNRYMIRKYDLRSMYPSHKAIYNFLIDNEKFIEQLKPTGKSQTLSGKVYDNIQDFIYYAELIQHGGDEIDPINNTYIRDDEKVDKAFKEIEKTLTHYFWKDNKKVYTNEGIIGTLKDPSSQFRSLIDLDYNTDPKSKFNLATLKQYGKNPKNATEAMQYIQYQIGLLQEFIELGTPASLLSQFNTTANSHSARMKDLKGNAVLISKKNKLSMPSALGIYSFFNYDQCLKRSNQEAIYEIREDAFKMLESSGYLLTADPQFIAFMQEKVEELGYMSSGDMTKYMATYTNFALSYMVHNYSSFSNVKDDMKALMFSEKRSTILTRLNFLKDYKKLYNDKFKGVFDNLTIGSTEVNDYTNMYNVSLFNPKQTTENRNDEIIKYEDAYKRAIQMKANPLNDRELDYATKMIDMLELLCNFSIYQHGLINTMASFQDTLPSGLYSKVLNGYLTEAKESFHLLSAEKPAIDKLLAQNFYYNGLFVQYANKPLSIGNQGKYITTYFQGAMTLMEEVKEMDPALMDSLVQNDPRVMNGYATEDEIFTEYENYKYQPISILGNRGKYIAFSTDNPSLRMNTAPIKNRSFISREFDEDDLAAREQALVGSSTQEATTADDDLLAREEAMQSSQSPDFEIAEEVIPFESKIEDTIENNTTTTLDLKVGDVVILKDDQEGDILEILENDQVKLAMDHGDEIIDISEIASIKPNEKDDSGGKDANC